MKTINLSTSGVQELTHNESKIISGGKDGDLLYWVSYGISFLISELEESISDHADDLQTLQNTNPVSVWN